MRFWFHFQYVHWQRWNVFVKNAAFKHIKMFMCLTWLLRKVVCMSLTLLLRWQSDIWWQMKQGRLLPIIGIAMPHPIQPHPWHLLLIAAWNCPLGILGREGLAASPGCQTWASFEGMWSVYQFSIFLDRSPNQSTGHSPSSITGQFTSGHYAPHSKGD